jgi:Tol biopolymer transport system component
MSRFDRIAAVVIAGLGVLLVGLVFWASQTPQQSPRTSPVLLYLSSIESGETQVWELDWETRQNDEVALLPGWVLGQAALLEDGRAVYPVERADGGHDLWMVDVYRRRAQRWVACESDDCLAVTSAPDGRNVVYTRVAEGVPALWLAQSGPTRTGPSETSPLFPDAVSPGHYPAWSPDGMRLAYVDPGGQICIVDFGGASETLCIAALMEATPIWSPDGSALLVTDMRLETGFANHIWRVDVNSGVFVDLSNTYGVEDDAPVWSPDGQWIAFRRKAAGTAMGKQIWLMRIDGSEVRPITADADSHYGPPVWLPDGETLLAARYTADERGIWAISTVAETAVLVAPDGYLPHVLTASLRSGSAGP